MTPIQMLLAAVGAETTCIVFLFGLVMIKGKATDKRLIECEKDRKAQALELTAVRQQVTDIWRELYEKAKHEEPVKKA